MPCRSLLACAFLALPGCIAPLTEEPWQNARKGSYGRTDRMGIYEDYSVDSRLQFETNNGPVDQSFPTDLAGRLGLALELEYFVADDVSVHGGIDYRLFDAEESPGIILDDVSTLGGTMSLRWLLPYRWLESGRLRPFVEGTLGYVPTTRFDFELDLDAPGIANPVMEFRGDDYIFLGAAAGLAYQASDNLVAHFTLAYEWPMGSTDDPEVILDLDIPTIPAVPVDTSIEPSGLIAFFGLTYYF